MTNIEWALIEKLNDIQLKVSTALGRVLSGNVQAAHTILGFARNDIIRIVNVLGEAPTKSTSKEEE